MSGTLFDTTTQSAVISDCGAYRYELRRVWNPDAPLVGWVMLNPSTADADVDDPTIRRCIGFAKEWGAGGIAVVNLFALRATDPASLALHDDPHGVDNWQHWQVVADEAQIVVCAWGAHHMAAFVVRAIVAALRGRGVEPRCLGTTKSGAPRHPLYVRGGTPLVPFGATGGETDG